MNDIVLENFINFCDDMQIAEEGLFSKKLKPEENIEESTSQSK